MVYKNFKFSFLIFTILILFFCKDVFIGERSHPNEYYKKERDKMVKIIEDMGIRDKKILKAMKKIPRHLYIPKKFRGICNPYGNHPCYIGYGQTISQPYIVAYMTEKLDLKKNEKILEVGTGSGYQSAVLAEMGCKVYSVERIKELVDHSTQILKSESYKNVKVAFKDGYKGWAEFSPYDAVIVTCAPEKVPEPLVKQLKEGGRMIIPVGKYSQRLLILKKREGKIKIEEDLYVRFVPMKKNKN